jgi:hypothetical protein
MAAPISPMQGTGQTGAMELVPDQPLNIFVVPNQMVHTFLNTISNPPCSFGLSATSQQYFYLRTNQPPTTSQQ